MREKFVATESENGLLFQLVTEKAEALKLLENILRYTELVFFEVKRDALRRSERNYTNWAEEQRRELFAKHSVLKVSLFCSLPLLFNTDRSNYISKALFSILLVGCARSNKGKFTAILQRTPIECKENIFSSTQ